MELLLGFHCNALFTSVEFSSRYIHACAMTMVRPCLGVYHVLTKFTVHLTEFIINTGLSSSHRVVFVLMASLGMGLFLLRRKFISNFLHEMVYFGAFYTVFCRQFCLSIVFGISDAHQINGHVSHNAVVNMHSVW